MNLIAALVAFTVIGWVTSVSAVALHLFRERPWVQYPAFFVMIAGFAFAVPVSVGVGFLTGGN